MSVERKGDVVRRRLHWQECLAALRADGYSWYGHLDKSNFEVGIGCCVCEYRRVVSESNTVVSVVSSRVGNGTVINELMAVDTVESAIIHTLDSND